MSALQQQILQDAPLGYWPLDELSGTTAKDHSGFGNNGTRATGASLATDPFFGRCYVFDGTASGSAAVAMGDVASMDRGDLTVAVWLKPDAFAGSMVTMAKYNSGTSPTGRGLFALTHSINASGEFTLPQWYWWQSASSSLYRYAWMNPYTGSLGAGNRWHHWAGSMDAANNMILYHNGVEINRNAVAASGTKATSTDVSFGLGSYANAPSSQYRGRMAHAAVFPGALSAERIRAQFLAGLRMGVVAG